MNSMNRIAVYHIYVTRLAACLAVCCALSVFLYGIFLLMAVTHTASRTAAERRSTSISTHLGDTDMQYLTQQKTLTPERAAELGFVKSTSVSTVFASASTHTLSLTTLR